VRASVVTAARDRGNSKFKYRPNMLCHFRCSEITLDLTVTECEHVRRRDSGHRTRGESTAVSPEPYTNTLTST